MIVFALDARNAGWRDETRLFAILAAGIALGPPLLGLLGTDDAISVIGKLGVTLLMLYIGIHLDPMSIGKAARPGLLASLGGFLVPAGLGFGLMMFVDGDAVAAAYQPDELPFGGLQRSVRHHVEEADVQFPDVLVDRAVQGQHLVAVFPEAVESRQVGMLDQGHQWILTVPGG